MRIGTQSPRHFVESTDVLFSDIPFHSLLALYSLPPFSGFSKWADTSVDGCSQPEHFRTLICDLTVHSGDEPLALQFLLASEI